MLVPGHLVSLFIATHGASGSLLGSDEKEIILMVYVVIDSLTGKVIGVQQYIVRPTGSIAKDTTNSPDTNSLTTISPTSIATTTSFLSLTEGENTSTTVSELGITDALINVAGQPLQETIDKFDEYVRSLSIDPDNPNFRLVVDGQLPLRQCLHPEACAKEIELPSYYWRFCDLRKEFVRFKAADLSRALISVKDIKKLPNMPSLPSQPDSIDDMMKELELTHDNNDSNFFSRESRDMATVTQAMIVAGHKFEPNEIINLVLEPGICSVDDEIDGQCIVRARGLPWASSDQDIAKFFRGLNVAKGGVALCLSAQGRRNGEALVRFVSQEHRDMALKRHKHHIGPRYIEVYRASGEDFLNVAGGASNEAQAFLSKGALVIIRMRGLPYDCTPKQVLDFFSTGPQPCDVLDGADGILFVKKPDGRATGDAFVLFSSENDAPKAMLRHKESIGQRYIEIFRSSTAEVQQVLNRSMDPKTYEPIQPPLIAQLPPVQMPLLPQHIITRGTSKSCIRLRGLPYEARVEHILSFLEDFAINIIYQGVHMVYNTQGQPSGEAFIQMDSEESARASAHQKHNKYMVFGKKYRYIEVFQCSGDDMNLVLNGGIPSPTNATKPPTTTLLSPGMLTSQPPQQLVTHNHLNNNNNNNHQHHHHLHLHHPHHQTSPTGGIPITIPPPLTLSIPPPNSALLAQQQAQFIAQQNLIARQQAAAANVAAAVAAAAAAVAGTTNGNSGGGGTVVPVNGTTATTTLTNEQQTTLPPPPPLPTVSTAPQYFIPNLTIYHPQVPTSTAHSLATQQQHQQQQLQQHQLQQQQQLQQLHQQQQQQHPQIAQSLIHPHPLAIHPHHPHQIPPQFVLMPRQQQISYIPMGLIPTPFSHPSTMAFQSPVVPASHLSQMIPTAHQLAAAAAAANSVKRTYETAFQQDTRTSPTPGTTPKRHFTRTPTTATNFYAPYYPPTI